MSKRSKSLFRGKGVHSHDALLGIRVDDDGAVVSSLDRLLDDGSEIDIDIDEGGFPDAPDVSFESPASSLGSFNKGLAPTQFEDRFMSIEAESGEGEGDSSDHSFSSGLHSDPMTDSSVFVRMDPDEFLDGGSVFGMLNPLCTLCNRGIAGKGYLVNGRVYHVECTKCVNCKVLLEPPTVVMERGELLCTSCAMARERCVVCSEQLANGEGVVVKDGIICESCEAVVKDHKCAVCNELVLYDGVEKFGKYFHKEHFKCETCGVVLKGNAFVSHHNRAYCFTHGRVYLETCARCKGSIAGIWAEPLKWRRKVFHAACFLCRVCGVSLRPDTAQSCHGRPHCVACFRMKHALENGIGHRHSPRLIGQLRRHVENERRVDLPVYSLPGERFLMEKDGDHPTPRINTDYFFP